MSGTPPFFPELLERFMSECDDPEHWITVEEFRTRLSLKQILGSCHCRIFSKDSTITSPGLAGTQSHGSKTSK